MKYYLLYSWIFLGCFVSFAQENDKDTTDGFLSNNDVKLNLLEVGGYLATPLNESFVSNSDSELGFEIGSSLIIWDQLLIGLGYNQFKLKNHDVSITGYHGDTKNSALYFQVGYQYRINNKMTTFLNYAIGEATYKHQLYDSPEDFEDKALYNNLSIKLNYEIGKRVAINFYAGYRFDVLNVEVPEVISELYDNASYFNSGLSVSFFIFKYERD